MFSGISIIWDREFGFLKEVLVAPVPRWGIALGKILGGATVVMCQSVIMIALAPLVGVTLSLAIVVQLLLLCFLMSFAMTSLGVLVASRMRSMQSFQMVMNFLVMPLYFLSGGMFPVSSAPAWMKTLMTLDPLTYGIDALRHTVLSGTLPAGSLERSLADVARQAGLIRWDLPFDVAILTLVAGLLAAVAAYSFSTAESA
jgi:ABC-2 type transport system permease protein